MDKLIDGARTRPPINDNAKYDNGRRRLHRSRLRDVPRVPLYQPYVNVATQKNISGY